MTNKEYLSQVYKLQNKIDKMNIRYQEYERLASSVPGPNYDGVRVDGTRNLDAPFVKWVGKMIDLKAVIDSNQKKLDEIKTEVIGVIEALDNEDYKNVLMLRYISFLSWDDIADKLYVVKRTVLRWHDKALSELKV